MDLKKYITMVEVSYLKKHISLFLILILVMSSLAGTINVVDAQAADYPEISYELIDSEEDLLDITDFAEPFLKIEKNLSETTSFIYKVNIEEMGSLFISDYNTKDYSYYTGITIEASQNSSFIKALSRNYYTKSNNIVGAYKYEEIKSFHFVPGVYYIKITAPKGKSYENVLFASFIKDSDLIAVKEVKYNSDYSSASVFFDIQKQHLDGGAGSYYLYEGLPTQKMISRETGTLINSSTGDYYSKNRISELTEKGIALTENGDYTLLYGIPRNEFSGLYVATTFTVDSIGGEILPEKVKLNKSSASLAKGEKDTLKASISPSNAVDKTVTWKSSKKSVATVSKKGVITAKGTGTCTITATTKNGKKATCKITVSEGAKATATPTPTPNPTETPTPTPKPAATPTPTPKATENNGFPYMATLDISSKGWTAYKPGTKYDMSGEAAGTIYQGASVQVLEEKGTVSKVYSYDLKKECYITTKYLKKVEGDVSTFNLSTGFYYVIPKCAPSSCLDVQGRSKDENANIQIWTKQEEQQSNQIFRVEAQSDGTYIFTSLVSGRNIDIEGGKAKNKANLVQTSGNATKDTQKFYLMKSTNDSDYATIVSAVDSKYCIDVDNAGKTDGTNVWLYESNNTSAQMFKFEKVSKVITDNGITDGKKDIVTIEGEKADTTEDKMAEAALILKKRLNGVYFTKTQKRVCGESSGEDDDCNVSTVVKSSWMKTLFGDYYTKLRLDQTSWYPAHINFQEFTGGGGYHCYGFANFAQFFIYSYAYGDMEKYSKDFNLVGNCVYRNKKGEIAHDRAPHYETETAIMDYVKVGDTLRLSIYPDGHYDGSVWNHSGVVISVDKENKKIDIIECNNGKANRDKITVSTITEDGLGSYKYFAVCRPTIAFE